MVNIVVNIIISASTNKTRFGSNEPSWLQCYYTRIYPAVNSSKDDQLAVYTDINYVCGRLSFSEQVITDSWKKSEIYLLYKKNVRCTNSLYELLVNDVQGPEAGAQPMRAQRVHVPLGRSKKNT